MSTGKRARERDETMLGEGGPPKKPRTGHISWEDAFPAKFRHVVSLSEITSSRTKTFTSGHIGPLIVVKVDHFTSPIRTRLTLREPLGSDLWFECDIHHDIARINDPKIGDYIRLSLSNARPSFRIRPGFYECRVEIYDDYFLFIESSRGPERLLTNTTCVLSSEISSSLFMIYPALPAVPSSSTSDRGNARDCTQGNTIGDSSMVDADDKGKPWRRRCRTRKKRDKISLPTILKDPPVLPLTAQEKSMDTSNISLNNSPVISSKELSVDDGVQQVLHKTQEADTALRCLPQVGTLFQHVSLTQPISCKGWILYVGQPRDPPIEEPYQCHWLRYRTYGSQEKWRWVSLDLRYFASQVEDAEGHIDWAKTYYLSDPSRPESMKGFAVNLFSKVVDWLPDAEVGQILILRSLLVRLSPVLL